jgi:hypothetical protein
MAGLRAALVVLAAIVLVTPASGGGADPGAARLRALLADAHVSVDRGTTPTVASFPSAWAAFQRFARTGARSNSPLLFEFGVFESRFWGTSFEVVLKSGPVHLVVHFPVAAYIAITRDLRATPCLPGKGCAFSCFFTGDDGLIPRACRVAPDGYRVGDMTLSGRRITTWIAGVESSPVFRALLARHVRPVGFEVWAE